jgi:hypothetical protein
MLRIVSFESVIIAACFLFLRLTYAKRRSLSRRFAQFAGYGAARFVF